MVALVGRLSVAEIEATCGDAQRNHEYARGCSMRGWDARTPEQRLGDEAARRRRELREEQDRHEVTRQVLRDTNRMLLSVYLRERMHAPGDFEIYVGLDRVVDDEGRVVWERVDVLLGELLAARPHLEIRGGVVSRERPTWALEWLSTGS